MKTSVALLSCLILCTNATIARGQNRPFVFSVTTAPDVSKTSTALTYDIGVGDTSFRASQSSGPEQRVGIQVSAGRWTFLGRLGLTSANATYETSQQGEALYSIFTQGSNGIAVAIGGGMLVAGREFGRWRLHGNLLFQKPMASGRDPIDIITTVGWMQQLSGTVSLGIEGVAEDVEGFWDPAEAEGGARLLVGPSLHVAPTGRPWQLSLAGGPMIHLPSQSAPRGYAFRTSFSCTF
jgi:hypothetical protein